jgi:hypothetical protein
LAVTPEEAGSATTSWLDYIVNRHDLRQTRVEGGPKVADVAIKPGEVLLRIDRFGLTSNNVGYAALGETMDYWSFFPAKDGWGRIPVWGFADIARSRHDELAEGERLYGYFPMSTYLVMPVDKVSAASFTNGSPHRRDKPAIYNRYVRLAADQTYNRADDGSIAIFRPLFATAFLIDDFLASREFFGARAIVLTSASSKTAVSLAFILSARGTTRPAVVGLTGRDRVQFVQSIGYFDRVVAYEALDAIPCDEDAVLVDFAGNTKVVEQVHRHWGSRLCYSASVGISRWERTGPGKEPIGPTPEFFSAPTYATRRIGDWGMTEFQGRLFQATQRFLLSANRWFRVVERRGPSQVDATYRAILEGKANPAEGYLASLHETG